MSKAWHAAAGPGGSRAWGKLRAAVLDRNREVNGGRCTLAIPGTCTGTATHVHHVLGRQVTRDDPRYLAATCAPCNQAIGDPRKSADPPARPVTRW